MWRFLTFLIFIILIQRLLKSLQEQQKEQKQPTEQELKNYFQGLGFPREEEIPAESKPEPKPEKPKQPVIVKKEAKELEVETAEPKPVEIEFLPKKAEEVEEELPDFSTDKLEQGIVFSAILGPPKAYKIRRSGEIGRRA